MSRIRKFAAALLLTVTAGMAAMGMSSAASEVSGEESTGQQTASALELAQKAKRTGLVESDGSFYYLEKGKMVTKTWKEIDGNRRYFKASGKAAVNQVMKIKGKYYYFNGKAVLGTAKKAYTVKTKRGWYFVTKKGLTGKKGWHKIGKKKYYARTNGSLLTGICKVKGTYYYFSSKGGLKKAKKDRIVSISGTDYLVRSSGKMGKGWCAIDGKYYYCKKNGKILKNTKKDGIKIDENGVAERAPLSGLDAKAASIVASITKSGMTQGEKIRACWNFMTSHSNFYYSTAYYPAAYSQSEFRRLGLLMLNGRAGNCYCFAAGFAALTKACGLTSYVVYGLCPGRRDGRADGMTRHCWVYIAGHGYFDPEATYAGFASIYASGGNPWTEHGRVAI